MKFSGVVQEGSRKAGELGVPTINIPLGDSQASGIYAALVRLEEKEHPAVAYADHRRRVLEAHLLSHNENLYGKEVAVRLVEKLREDREFADATDQERTIRADVTAAKAFFAKPS